MAFVLDGGKYFSKNLFLNDPQSEVTSAGKVWYQSFALSSKENVLAPPISEEVVRVLESELNQSKGLLSDASLASSDQRLACLARRKPCQGRGPKFKSVIEMQPSLKIPSIGLLPRKQKQSGLKSARLWVEILYVPMSTADPSLDGLSPKGNLPPQGGEVNPYPNVLGIHNSRGPRSQQNSSKSRITRKNSPVVHFAPN
ncbi:hypothetical protein PIB30_055117 [Stylosanthes scabra]|uniref:Uncharacterized protein n=1 Tax=Stylosanthes scabra TaxID=79078 RepID=A0ABU6VH48_9FABA|nr:hypothetical protein [Stylosanthes scabra]